MSAIDWRQMEAGRDLDKVIAERLGYTTTVTPVPEGEHYASYVTALYWMRVDAHIPIPIPHYSTDLNAAFALPIPADAEINLKFRASGWHVATFGNYFVQWTQGYDKVPAAAICRAWLAWKEVANG